MNFILTFFCLLFSISCVAQPKDLSKLPAYDCALQKLMSIISKPTIIVSPDKRMGLENILNDYCASLGNNCIQKKESELSLADLPNNLLIVGGLNDFKHPEKFTRQIVLNKNGFIVNNKLFRHPLDGFVFVDTNRIIVGGNTLQAVKDAQLALTGGHDILITQKGKITFFGNKKGQSFDWFNLQNLKATNYTLKPSNLFSAIYISKGFKEVIDHPKLDKEIRTYVQQFLTVYKIKMPVKKVSWFLHSNMQEYGTMSGMFGLTCAGSNSAGFSIRGEIHTNGFNTGLMKHEYSHFLFDNTIPQDNNPAFFVEGCVEYVTNLNDTSLYKQRLAIAKKYRDTLNYADLIIKNKDFYGQYSEANYSVCGILVKYIIDSFGVEAFKRYCLVGNKAVTTKNVFKKDFDEVINGYKQWLDESQD